VIDEYPETHQQGHVMVHNQEDVDAALATGDVDFGVQIATDGRVWVCVDGLAYLRFKPAPKGVRKEEG